MQFGFRIGASWVDDIRILCIMVIIFRHETSSSHRELQGFPMKLERLGSLQRLYFSDCHLCRYNMLL